MSEEKPKRSKRIYVYWGVALALLLTLGVFCWAVVVPSPRASPVAKPLPVSVEQYLKMKPFIATVKEVRSIPLDPRGRYHSAAMPGLHVVLEREDGRLLSITRGVTDMNSAWAHGLRRLEVGKTYIFDKDRVSEVKPPSRRSPRQERKRGRSE